MTLAPQFQSTGLPTVDTERPELELSEIEGRARAVIGGAAEFDRMFPDPEDAFGVDPNKPQCEYCGENYPQRKGSGGKPQRFCKTECRTAWHAEHPKAQHGPTCSAQTELLGPIQPPAPKIGPSALPIKPWEVGGCFAIPPQDRIEVAATNEEEIELLQYDSHDEESKIIVSRRNAVALAQNILNATGFVTFGIWTRNSQNEGNYDVRCGNIPEDFE